MRYKNDINIMSYNDLKNLKISAIIWLGLLNKNVFCSQIKKLIFMD